MMNTQSKSVVAGVLLAASFSASADGAFAVYWQEVPGACKELGPVEYSESFKRGSPETKVPRGELEQRARDKCVALAKEKGGNALADKGVTRFHGRDSFGYECKAVAYKC